VQTQVTNEENPKALFPAAIVKVVSIDGLTIILKSWLGAWIRTFAAKSLVNAGFYW